MRIIEQTLLLLPLPLLLLFRKLARELCLLCLNCESLNLVSLANQFILKQLACAGKQASSSTSRRLARTSETKTKAKGKSFCRPAARGRVSPPTSAVARRPAPAAVCSGANQSSSSRAARFVCSSAADSGFALEAGRAPRRAEAADCSAVISHRRRTLWLTWRDGRQNGGHGRRPAASGATKTDERGGSFAPASTRKGIAAKVRTRRRRRRRNNCRLFSPVRRRRPDLTTPPTRPQRGQSARSLAAASTDVCRDRVLGPNSTSSPTTTRQANRRALEFELRAAVRATRPIWAAAWRCHTRTCSNS